MDKTTKRNIIASVLMLISITLIIFFTGGDSNTSSTDNREELTPGNQEINRMPQDDAMNQRPGNKQALSQDSIDACSDLNEDDICILNLDDNDEGICVLSPENILLCVPEKIDENIVEQPNIDDKLNNSQSYLLYNTCLENTKNEKDSKDCCDCLNESDLVRKECRDATVDYDFSKNTNFKEFVIPSELGADGDYSICTSLDEQECKQCCDDSNNFVCGDYQYCRTACVK